MARKTTKNKVLQILAARLSNPLLANAKAFSNEPLESDMKQRHEVGGMIVGNDAGSPRRKAFMAALATRETDLKS